MTVIESCNLCGSSSFVEVLKGRDLMYNLDGVFTLVKCEKCGLKFVNPQPDSSELSSHYPSKYYSVSGKVERSAFSEFLYKLYFSGRGSLLLKLLFYPIYPILRGAKVVPGKRVLDVGCGSGVFLSRMKGLGMEVHGVDPFIERDILEFNIVKGGIEAAGFQQDFFDVVTMNNVLEHVPDPKEELRRVSEVLKEGGVAIIAVPNVGSVFFKFLGRYWAELDLPRHLFFFDEPVLMRYFENAGLKVVKVRYNCVPFEITGSLFYLLNSFRKRKALSESFIANSTLLNLFLLPVCHLLNLMKLGGRIEFYVQK